MDKITLGSRNVSIEFPGVKALSNVDFETLSLLLAGELIHIGKNTSFGFGRYTVVPQ